MTSAADKGSAIPVGFLLSRLGRFHGSDIYDVLNRVCLPDDVFSARDIMQTSGGGKLKVPIKVGYRPTPMFDDSLLELSISGISGSNCVDSL